MTFLNMLKILVIVVTAVLWTVVIATVETGTYPRTILEFLAVGVGAIVASLPILIVIVFSTVIIFAVIFPYSELPRTYKNRNCQGIYWRRLFPDVRKEDIREFIQILVDVLLFREKDRCKFRPDDLVLEIFRDAKDTDGMDLYDYIRLIEQDYKVDITGLFDNFDDDDVTLGQVFAFIVRNKPLLTSKVSGEYA